MRGLLALVFALLFACPVYGQMGGDDGSTYSIFPQPGGPYLYQFTNLQTRGSSATDTAHCDQNKSQGLAKWVMACPSAGGGGTTGSSVMTFNDTTHNLSPSGAIKIAVTGSVNQLTYLNLGAFVKPAGGANTAGTLTITLATPTYTNSPLAANSVTVSATAAATSGTVSSMQVFADNVLLTTVNATTISYSITGLSYGPTHNIVVKAFDSVSNVAQVTTFFAAGPDLTNITNIESDYYEFVDPGVNYLYGIEGDPDVFLAGSLGSALGSWQFCMTGNCSSPNTFRVWDGLHNSWQDKLTGNPCTVGDTYSPLPATAATYSGSFPFGKWVHVQIRVHITHSVVANDQSARYTYDKFAVDGKPIWNNLGYDRCASLNGFAQGANVQFQEDVSNAAPANFVNTFWIDNYRVTLW
jgi:hypothetical protein